MRTTLAVPLVLLSATASAGPAQVRHDPIACVPGDRHVRVTTRAEPAEAAVAVELQFRAEGSDWYGVAMAREDGVWSARLPRAAASLPRFDYRLVTTTTDAEVTESEPVAVAVKADCDTAGQASLTSSIIVRVPPGAPLVPPVPPGFSPAGIVAAQERMVAGVKRREPRWTGYAIGAAVSGVAGAALARSGGAVSEPPEVLPGFALQRVSPGPGAVLTPQTTMLVFVSMDREPEQPLTFDWRLELRDRRSDGFAPPCATASGSLRGAKRPLGLVLTAPLTLTGTCGRSFSTSFVTLVLTMDGRTIHEEAIHVPYTFQP